MQGCLSTPNIPVVDVVGTVYQATQRPTNLHIALLLLESVSQYDKQTKH